MGGALTDLFPDVLTSLFSIASRKFSKWFYLEIIIYDFKIKFICQIFQTSLNTIKIRGYRCQMFKLQKCIYRKIINHKKNRIKDAIDVLYKKTINAKFKNAGNKIKAAFIC